MAGRERLGHRGRAATATACGARTGLGSCPPKAEVAGSNPVGSANSFNGLREDRKQRYGSGNHMATTRHDLASLAYRH